MQVCEGVHRAYLNEEFARLTETRLAQNKITFA